LQRRCRFSSSRLRPLAASSDPIDAKSPRSSAMGLQFCRMEGWPILGNRVDESIPTPIGIQNTFRMIACWQEKSDILLEEDPPNGFLNSFQGVPSSNHCFAAKNVFFRRWECPLPTSPTCNAGCLGCISLQPSECCPASQERIDFVPSVD